MKKLIAMVAVLAAMLVATPGHAAVEVRQSRNFYLSWSSGPNSANMWANVYIDPVSGVVYSSYASISVGNGMGYRYGWSNNVTIDTDPLARRATITGFFVGNDSQPISVSLTFLSTRVETNLPYASAEVVPGGPSASAFLFGNTQGRSNGSVQSGVGTVNVTDGFSNLQAYTTITGP